MSLPPAARPFVGFASLLRRNGFAVAPDQTLSFLEAITLLGPRGLADIRQAALATLAPPPERRAAFDLLFRLHFLGEDAPQPGDGDDEQVLRVPDERRGADDAFEPESLNEAGEAATSAEVLSQRRFQGGGEAEALRRLARGAAGRLPQRRSYRRVRGRGAAIDLRRTWREAARNDGEVLRLSRLRRRMRPRRVLLLIDVSGSMKGRTEANLRLAHTLSRSVARLEVFTFGTRLTRVTRPLRLRRPEQALVAAAALVSDFDGGTRIGEALLAFLAIPRFAGYARGAVTLIVSDGLERGDPAPLADAVARLSRRAWRLDWLTPLATAPGFRPQTEGLRAAAPFIDAIVPGGTSGEIVDHILGRRRAA